MRKADGCGGLFKVVGLSIVAPTIAMLPFVLKVTDDCAESLVGHSLWMGRTFLFSRVFSTRRSFFDHSTNMIFTVVGSVGSLMYPMLNYAFLSVPFGWHTVRVTCTVLL